MSSIHKISTADLPWNPFRNKANIKNLTDKDLKIDLIKLEPNQAFDNHIHQTTEWLFVIEGQYSDAYGTYAKGDLVINEHGSHHQTKSGGDGCVILLIKMSN